MWQSLTLHTGTWEALSMRSHTEKEEAGALLAWVLGFGTRLCLCLWPSLAFLQPEKSTGWNQQKQEGLVLTSFCGLEAAGTKMLAPAHWRLGETWMHVGK